MLDNQAFGEQLIHEFDLSNLYTIGRFWEAGSCPHLFGCAVEGRSVRYLGELFARQPGRSQTERVIVPEGTTALLIAELEQESTTIERVRVNGRLYSSVIFLNKGDTVELAVRSGDAIELTGFYTARHSGLPDPWLRNSVVHEFMLCATPPVTPDLQKTSWNGKKEGLVSKGLKDD